MMETKPLTPDQAIAFLNASAEEGQKILGIDRVFIRGDEIVADLEEIADFTMDQGKEQDRLNEIEAACKFVKLATTEDSYFTIVYRQTGI